MSKTIYLLSEKGLPFPSKGSTFSIKKVYLFRQKGRPFFEESGKPILKIGIWLINNPNENMRYLAFTLSADFQFVRIVVDDVFNLCFHISDNLMVHTLCCRFHSSAYKTSIGIHKVYYLLVVYCVLVAHSTTLHHLQSL